jgi:hypothetical protein
MRLPPRRPWLLKPPVVVFPPIDLDNVMRMVGMMK